MHQLQGSFFRFLAKEDQISEHMAKDRAKIENPARMDSKVKKKRPKERRIEKTASSK